MDDADRAQLARVEGAVGSAIGAAVLGSYLHGSAVLGGLRPSSDLDVLVVVDQPVGAAGRHRLVEGLLRVSGHRAEHPGRPAEVTAVEHGALHPWEHPAVAAFQYGEWRRAEYEAGLVPGPVRSPDLTILLDSAQRHGRRLSGPEPHELLPAVPPEDVVVASVSGAAGLLDDLAGDERNVLLTFARMLVTAEQGTVVPKDVAALAAADQVTPEAGEQLRAAAEDYRGEASHDWSARTRAVEAAAAELLSRVRLLTGT